MMTKPQVYVYAYEGRVDSSGEISVPVIVAGFPSDS